ncbi:MAG: response regulator transcription factor [Pseudanabaenaceae cyanobacterium SKYGB_i_bin29]|nr:response regulator transcription factor [Pseudanabaenaceae cyanobacterium SKYG29]MDW8421194.1 response regulator transcription factor [Pseudanabaenaceae cyanobacterium SKYGB_i_bin29]
MLSSTPRVLRVLIADDHELTRCALKFMLMRHQFLQLVGVAGNGKEVLEKVEKERPDVVILDMHMPVMDGWSASRIIKHHWPEVRIVAYSSVEGGKERALAEGAIVDAFCEKGTCVNKLVEVIRSLF